MHIPTEAGDAGCLYLHAAHGLRGGREGASEEGHVVAILRQRGGEVVSVALGAAAGGVGMQDNQGDIQVNLGIDTLRLGCALRSRASCRAIDLLLL
jgi:hypothetical protein